MASLPPSLAWKSTQSMVVERVLFQALTRRFNKVSLVMVTGSTEASVPFAYLSLAVLLW
jgi:hypothetical protein